MCRTAASSCAENSSATHTPVCAAIRNAIPPLESSRATPAPKCSPGRWMHVSFACTMHPASANKQQIITRNLFMPRRSPLRRKLGVRGNGLVLEEPRRIVRAPDAPLRPKPGILVERCGAQDHVRRVLPCRDDLASAHRAEKPLLARRGFVRGQFVLAGQPAEALPRDTAGGRECRRVCLAAGDAMAMPEGIQASDFIRYRPALTT